MIRHSSTYRFLVIATLSFVMIGGSIQTVVAQSNAKNTELAVQLTDARAQNHKQSLRYSWTSRTEVKIKGEQKVLKSEAVHYSPDAQLVKSPLGQTEDSGRKARGLRKIAKKKKQGDMQDWAGELGQLLQKYNLPTSGKILDFVNAAQVSGGPRSGTTQIRGINVVKPGDSLTMIVDSNTKALLETKIETVLDGDPVQMRTVQSKLDSGLAYTAETSITVPAKKVEMNVQNFSYIKN